MLLVLVPVCIVLVVDATDEMDASSSSSLSPQQQLRPSFSTAPLLLLFSRLFLLGSQGRRRLRDRRLRCFFRVLLRRFFAALFFFFFLRPVVWVVRIAVSAAGPKTKAAAGLDTAQPIHR